MDSTAQLIRSDDFENVTVETHATESASLKSLGELGTQPAEGKPPGGRRAREKCSACSACVGCGTAFPRQAPARRSAPRPRARPRPHTAAPLKPAARFIQTLARRYRLPRRCSALRARKQVVVIGRPCRNRFR